MDPSERQELIDTEHLKLLAVGFFVVGAVYVLLAVFSLFYVFIGLIFFFAPPVAPPVPPAPPLPMPDLRGMGIVVALFGVVIAGSVAVVAALHFWAGVSIRRRKHRMLCLVTAALSCLFVPIGTFLGVCGIVVLSRPSVAQHFTPAEPMALAVPGGGAAG